MYFSTKSYLKINYNHTAKHALYRLGRCSFHCGGPLILQDRASSSIDISTSLFLKLKAVRIGYRQRLIPNNIKAIYDRFCISDFLFSWYI